MENKDIILLISGIVGGGLASWLITWRYYRKSLADQKVSSAEQAKILDKLPYQFKKMLDDDVRDSLTVLELNELLEKQVHDPKGPLGYKACPRCGNKNLKYGSHVDTKHDDLYEVVECSDPKCRWSDVMG